MTHSRESSILLFFVVMIVAVLIAAPLPASAISTADASPFLDPKRPMTFEPNNGQAPADHKFLARGRGFNLSLKAQELMFVQSVCLANGKEADPAASPENPAQAPPCDHKRSVVHMRLVGASPTATPAASDVLPGTVGYFTDRNPNKWIQSVPTYATVTYSNVYNGIDLVLHGDDSKLKFDFVVHPGADPDKIRIAWQGGQNAHLDIDGNFVFETSTGIVTVQKPNVYQIVAGQKVGVAASYVISKGTQLAFTLGQYDHTAPLIIDPVFIFAYSTANANWAGYRPNAAAVDSSGNLFVGGKTASYACAILDDSGNWAPSDTAYVAMFNSNGTLIRELLAACDTSWYPISSLKLDGTGNVYISAATLYSGWYTTPTAYRTTMSSASGLCGYGGSYHCDGYMAKFDHGLTQWLYGTYLGGYGWINGLAVNSTGIAYFTGAAYAWPTTAGAYQSTNVNGTNHAAFFSELSADGTQLLYSTYLAGPNATENQGYGIAIDGSGNAYLTGATNSASFPLVNPLQSNGPGFLACFNSSGSLTYSTHFSGTPHNIAVDSTGTYVWLSGTTGSGLTTVNAVQPIYGGSSSDAFIAKLNISTNNLVFSTYIGGSSIESGDGLASETSSGLAIDVAGNAYVVISTGSAGLPSMNAAQPTGFSGGWDAYFAAFDWAGALTSASYIGGSGSDIAEAVAIDARSTLAVYVLGATNSYNFPHVGSATLGADISGFIVKLTPPGTTPTATQLSADITSSACGDEVVFTATLSTVSGSLGGLLYLFDGTTWLQTFNLSGASASENFIYRTRALGPGNHTIFAKYSGDPTFSPSSASIQISVGATNCPTATTVSVWPDNSSNDFPSTVRVNVSPGSTSFGTPTGTVDIYAYPDYGLIGTVTLTSGVGTIGLPTSLLPGTYSVIAQYSGSNTFAPSSSSSPAYVLGLVVTSSAGPRADLGQPISFTASLVGDVYEGYVPTGTVSFSWYPDSGGWLNLGSPKTLQSNSAITYTLNGFAATDPTPWNYPTSFDVTAAYSGDSHYPGATSAMLHQRVGPGQPATTSLTANKTVAGSDEPITFNVRVSTVPTGTGQPGGTVDLMDGPLKLNTLTLVTGIATISRTLSPGTHTITALYGGNADYETSSSAPLTLTITASAPTVLTQMANAMWPAATMPADAVLAGTMTRHFDTGELSSTFTVKLKGQDEYKYSETGAPVAVVTNGNAGAIETRDAVKQRLSSSAARTMRGVIMPIMSRIKTWSDGAVSIAVVGQKTISSDLCVGVQLTRIFFMNVVPPGTVVEPPMTVWVSTASNLVLQVDYVRLSSDNKSAGTDVTVQFSDFRTVDGILVPFHQDESVFGQNTISIQFADNGVLFNQNLSDSEFSVCSFMGVC